MPSWWRKRQPEAAETRDDNSETEATLQPQASRQPHAAIPAQRGSEDLEERWDLIKSDLLELDPDFFDGLDVLAEQSANRVDELTDERLRGSLRRLSIRYLSDETGALVAMWERHVLYIRREGTSGEILVLRTRAFATLPSDWNERAFRAANEWNRTRRFVKSYVGDATESGRTPMFGEIQIPLGPGVSDAQLDELIDCAAAVSGAYVDWLHDEGGVL